MRKSETIDVACARCGAEGRFQVSQGAGDWGSGFRVDREPPGFREIGAAASRKVFRARCLSCEMTAREM